jgi:3-isopropylmalate/(R)-2-methylmalate dehydratase small subunit
MKSLTTINSTVSVIDRKDIDTDMIIPAQYMQVTTSEGFGEHLFARLREDADFAHLKERPEAKILVAGANFGSGSSREHAVWALLGFGFRVIIAPSFANIHQANALNNGLLEITLEDSEVNHIKELAQADPQFNLTVDLEKQQVILPNDTNFEFEIDPYRKTCILNGMDDFDYLISHLPEISKFDQERAGDLYFDLSQV